MALSSSAHADLGQPRNIQVDLEQESGHVQPRHGRSRDTLGEQVGSMISDGRDRSTSRSPHISLGASQDALAVVRRGKAGEGLVPTGPSGLGVTWSTWQSLAVREPNTADG